jgi:hypothetical protein
VALVGSCIGSRSDKKRKANAERQQALSLHGPKPPTQWFECYGELNQRSVA